MGKDKIYDAFLSYNSRDRDLIIQIGQWLIDSAHMKVWLDNWNLIPGDPWQDELETALDQSKVCVVFIGPNHIGPWQHEEMRSALDERVSKKTIRVVPVLLPGATREQKESELPRFLRRLSWVEFRKKIEEEDARHRLICGIKGIPPGRDFSTASHLDICPFRGLEVFREEDASFFFGREAIVQRLAHHLHAYHFLAVVGPSGSGKSSVVQAGVIPSLRPSHPLVTVFTPGNQPLTELASSLHNIYLESTSTEAILSRLKESEEALYFITRELAEDNQKNKGISTRVLIVVDQFEELFTQTANEDERKQFISLLLKTKEKANGKVSLVITMRSDFIGKCALYPDLNTFLNDHLVQIEPMSQEELLMAIEEPARLTSLNFEPGLVQKILDDVKGAYSELPLLEYALLELFNRRKGVLLTHMDYEEIGGVDGALVEKAEEEYKKLDSTQQEMLRRMFVFRLIQPGEGTEDTRRRSSREELVAIGGNRKLAEALINHWSGPEVRMLTSYQEQNQDYIDVAHEALIRKWGRIKKWLSEDRQDSLLIGRIRQDSLEWKASNNDAAYLYHGTRLYQMEEFFKKREADFTELEQDFIQSCIANREEQLRQEVNRREKELETVKAMAKAKEQQLADAQKLGEAQQKKLKYSKILLLTIFGSTILIGVFLYYINLGKEDAQNQLIKNYWSNAKIARKEQDILKYLHFVGEAHKINKDKTFGNYLLSDVQSYLPRIRLSNILKHDDEELTGAIINENETRIFIWGEKGTAVIWDAINGRKVSELMKQNVSILGAIINKDGTHIISWGKDGKIRRWDTESMEQVGDSIDHNSESLLGAVFNKDENQFLTWGSNGTARLWQTESGEQVGKPMEHEIGPILGAVFNKNGNRILTWGWDGTARLWNSSDGLQVGKPMEHEIGPILGAVFNKNGNRILTWGWDGTARLWNSSDGLQVGNSMKHENGQDLAAVTLDKNEAGYYIRGWDVLDSLSNKNGIGAQENSAVLGAIFSENESSIITWGVDGKARLWNADRGEQLGNSMEHASGPVLGALKNENRILTWGWDGTVRLWDTVTGKEVWRIEHEYGPVINAFFLKNENRVLIEGQSGTAEIWETADGDQEGVNFVNKFEGVFGFFQSDDKTQILTLGDRGASLWDTETGERVGVMMDSENGIVSRAIFYPRGKRILTWGKEGTARIWEISSERLMKLSIKHENGYVLGAVSKQNETQIITSGEDGILRFWKTVSGNLINDPIEHHIGPVLGAVFNEDKTQVLTWEKDGTLRFWKTSSGEQIGEPIEHKNGPVFGAVFSKGDKWILSWEKDGTARLWEIASRKQVGEPIEHKNGPVWEANFSKDDTWFLTVDHGGMVRVWETISRTQVGNSIKYENEKIFGAVFSKDDKYILTWGSDGTVRLWETESRVQVLNNFIKHGSGPVFGALFNKDETKILSWSSDGTIKLWEVSSGELLVKPKVHGGLVNGAVFNQDETRILSWGSDGAINLWETSYEEPMRKSINENKNIHGAIFFNNETEILTWAEDGIGRLLDIESDLDLPNNLLLLQIQVLTGTALDHNFQTVYCLPENEWLEKRIEYEKLAKAHYKNCKYPKANLWSKSNPKEAEKIRAGR
jgi:WD40 repeat protein/energy-coupling factor transporter ATP-binding protein EcfA2